MSLLFRKNIILLSSVVVTFVFMSSCQNQKENNSVDASFLENQSPLDTILGDKVLNAETGEIRTNNFVNLIGITTKQLELESELYGIEKIDQNHFIIKQKKRYSEARQFDILLKTNENEVTDFIAFNDFLVSDLKRDSLSWILLLSDFHQTNNYWKSKQQIRALKLDSDFNEVWNYTRSSNNFPLNGKTVSIGRDNYSLVIEVITGCHICLVVTEVLLSKSGEFQSVQAITNYNSEGISEEELLKLFN